MEKKEKKVKKVTKLNKSPQITVEPIGSKSGELSAYDWKSLLQYVILNVVALLIPLAITYIGKLDIPKEILASGIFILNTVLVYIKKRTQDRSNILKIVDNK